MPKPTLKALIIPFALAIAALAITLFAILAPSKSPQSDQFTITASNFALHDFARAITADTPVDNSLLVKPGRSTHDYDPSPEDILQIQRSDLFIYVGGESDAWIERLLDEQQISAKNTLRLLDLITPETEATALEAETEDHDSASSDYHSSDHATDIDEHIWTSPSNALQITQAIYDRLAVAQHEQITSSHRTIFAKNLKTYHAKLNALHQAFRDISHAATNRTLVFADPFPFRYFVSAYNFDYLAAFPGCSDESEASPQTVAKLIDFVNTNKSNSIFKIEHTSGQLAQTIADATGAKVYTLHSAHFITPEEFNRGLTYLDLMYSNAETLNQALSSNLDLRSLKDALK
ncbi:zinc ABC transporter substrate-binding protein [Candidatus Saccharibacteria bacterium]|nr:zinc ABC transporter substrate-binding protein [Candidatus Saccharibacteria bacterium]